MADVERVEDAAGATSVEEAPTDDLLESRGSHLQALGGRPSARASASRWCCARSAARSRPSPPWSLVVEGRVSVSPASAPTTGAGTAHRGSQCRAGAELGELRPVARRQRLQLLAPEGRPVLVEGRETAVAGPERGSGVSGGLAAPRGGEPADGALGRRAPCVAREASVSHWSASAAARAEGTDRASRAPSMRTWRSSGHRPPWRRRRGARPASGAAPSARPAPPDQPGPAGLHARGGQGALGPHQPAGLVGSGGGRAAPPAARAASDR